MKQTNRWLYAASGVTVMLVAGFIYAWSILSIPIAKEFTEWTKAQMSLTFTLGMSFFCIGGFISGQINNRINIKLKIVVAAILLLLGLIISSKATTIGQLYIGFGIIAGLGSGIAYNTVMGTVMKWFPDKRGLISGVSLMGFGMGSFFIGKIFQFLNPDTIGAWRGSYIVFAGVVFIIVISGAVILKEPNEAYITLLVKKSSVDDADDKKQCMDYSPKMMFGKSSFWLIYLWAILVSSAGLALVSQASGIVKEVSLSIDPNTVATVVGLISIFNGIGRILSGAIYDAKGYKVTMRVDMAVFIVTAIILIAAIKTGLFILVVVGFIIGGLAYGGAIPVVSAISSDFFGSKYYANNFSILTTNLIFASFSSTIAGRLFDMSGSYVSTIMMMIVATALAFICSVGIRRPAEVLVGAVEE